MSQKDYQISGKIVSCFFGESFEKWLKKNDRNKIVFLVDKNVYLAHQTKFNKLRLIVLPASEKYKTQQTIDTCINKLIKWSCDRQTILVGIGGGVISDITGYLASIYMRGIKFGFVPTSLLAMVDASIGGKNGINHGLYKNYIGTITQPDFIFFDLQFLKSLPESEWSNGFAEIIKHGLIQSTALIKQLEDKNISFYQSHPKLLLKLIQLNVSIKMKIIIEDEKESHLRKTLNFGHTLGHAIETNYNLPHGNAVAIGMVKALFLSAIFYKFKDYDRMIALIKKYNLPVEFDYQINKVLPLMFKDKKSQDDIIHFILLKKIGAPEIVALPKIILKKYLSKNYVIPPNVINKK